MNIYNFTIGLSLLLSIVACTDRKEEYHNNGTLKSVTEIELNMRNGKRETYFPNGTKESITNWKNDFLDGTAMYYDSTGVLKFERNFKGGLREGVNKIYTKGKLGEETFYINGLEHGVSKIYFENGVIQNVAHFSKGKLDSIYKTFYPNGNIKQEISYRNGIITGVVKAYYEKSKGSISSISHMLTIKNKLENMWGTEYNLDGSIKYQSPQVILKALIDTVNQGDSLNLQLELKVAEYPETKVIIGNFDEQFYIQSPAKYDTIKAKNHKAFIKINPDKKGKNYVRGFLRNSGVTNRTKKTHRVTVIDRYFEYPYYVK